MAELVADCPRCGSGRMTFDILAGVLTGMGYGWKQYYEAFGVCRHCSRATIFTVSDSDTHSRELVNRKGLAGVPGALGGVVDVDGYISQKDREPIDPPEHVPADIEAAFKEGAICLAVGCHNAAGTMFRLCVDHATRSLLPAADRDGLNAKVRRSLGLRMQWLFAQGLLPKALEDLSTCIREDGNDGAHAGTLTEADAQDLLDFTTALLERLYTEPGKLAAAAHRRSERRGKAG